MTRTTLPRSLTRRTCTLLCLSLALLFNVAAPVAGCSWHYLIWSPRHRDADALYRFVRGGKVGYIDRTGKIVVEPQYEKAYGNHDGEFREGILEVGVMSGRYVDVKGKAVEPAPYRGREFAEGLAAVRDEESGKWGYVDRSGEYVISPRFCAGCYAYNFSDGLALIKRSDWYGFIDRSGEFVVDPAFLHADNFREGMSRVVFEGPCTFGDGGPCTGSGVLGSGGAADAAPPPCKFTFVDRDGFVLEERFEDAHDFSEGLAPVRKGGKWGYIDKSGRFVIEPRFEEAWPFSDERALVRQDGLYGFIDGIGAYAVPPRYKYAQDFSDGLALVGTLYSEEPEGLRYIDRFGRVVISGPFHIADRFFKGLAHVELKPLKKKRGGELWGTRRFAYVNPKGKVVFSYEYEERY